METDQELLKRTYELARENNRMLHAMRRNAFIGGLIKMAIYGALIIVPLWYFTTTVLPLLNSAVGAMNNVQGKAVEFGAGVEGVQGTLNQLKGLLPTLSQ